jgi:hypothetical protein
LLGARCGNGGFAQGIVSKAPTRNANEFWKRGYVPEERCTALAAKVALLIFIADSIVKRVNGCFTFDAADSVLGKIRSDSERTPSTFFAVVAMAHRLRSRLTGYTHRN